jgi:hypothetical protein
VVCVSLKPLRCSRRCSLRRLRPTPRFRDATGVYSWRSSEGQPWLTARRGLPRASRIAGLANCGLFDLTGRMRSSSVAATAACSHLMASAWLLIPWAAAGVTPAPLRVCFWLAQMVRIVGGSWVRVFSAGWRQASSCSVQTVVCRTARAVCSTG